MFSLKRRSILNKLFLNQMSLNDFIISRFSSLINKKFWKIFIKLKSFKIFITFENKFIRLNFRMKLNGKKGIINRFYRCNIILVKIIIIFLNDRSNTSYFIKRINFLIIKKIFSINSPFIIISGNIIILSYFKNILIFIGILFKQFAFIFIPFYKISCHILIIFYWL